MLKELVIGACLVLPLAACTTPSPTREPVKTALVAPARTPGCGPDTATRIPVMPGTCAGFGQAYTREDILNTGTADTAQALRLLDPSLQLRRH
jgi:hypothetical protein